MSSALLADLPICVPWNKTLNIFKDCSLSYTNKFHIKLQQKRKKNEAFNVRNSFINCLDSQFNSWARDNGSRYMLHVPEGLLIVLRFPAWQWEQSRVEPTRETQSLGWQSHSTTTTSVTNVRWRLWRWWGPGWSPRQIWWNVKIYTFLWVHSSAGPSRAELHESLKTTAATRAQSLPCFPSAAFLKLL